MSSRGEVLASAVTEAHVWVHDMRMQGSVSMSMAHITNKGHQDDPVLLWASTWDHIAIQGL